MIISWRQLLDAIGMTWRDRGANTSRDHVNIKCPWCGEADPSYHLTINEGDGAYYCYRDPQRHYGRSAPYLLRALGIPGDQIDGLLQTYGSGKEASPSRPREPSPAHWERYDLATSSEKAVAYLHSRGFIGSRRVIVRQDLRVAKAGQYANRILIPLHIGDAVVGFTGRSFVGDSPSYLNSNPPSGALYMPATPYCRGHDVLLICEGPMDALAVAESPFHDLRPIAILGLALPPERLRQIVSLAQDADHILVALDGDQQISKAYNLIRQIEMVTRKPTIRCGLPDHYKDPGQLLENLEEMAKWLTHISRAGREYSRHGQKNTLAPMLGG